MAVGSARGNGWSISRNRSCRAHHYFLWLQITHMFDEEPGLNTFTTPYLQSSYRMGFAVDRANANGSFRLASP